MVCFGPYVLDRRTWTVSKDGALVDLSPRLVEILAHLISRGGEIVTKDELLDRFWPDTYVEENTLARAIADIRKALDDHAARPVFVQTLARRGYRFVAASVDEPEASAIALREAMPDPLRQWVDGRLALESLDLSRLNAAARAFEIASAEMPAYAPAHAGRANAYLLQFEATRTANAPDRAKIAGAIAAAREATTRDPRLGEGWAALGHAMALDGRLEDARAALLRAAALEPANWRHHFRLALASWGEERLRAADRTTALIPECAAVHLLSAMVFVARGALERAAASAAAGAALQERQQETAILPVAGLHWISGLVHCVEGDLDRAGTAFAREASGNVGQVYGREFIVNAGVALGFVRSHIGDKHGAAEAFRGALSIVPGHARAILGLFNGGMAPPNQVDAALAELEAGQKSGEAALIRAAYAAFDGRTETAVRVLAAYVESAPPGPAGWSLRADPIWLPLRDADGFSALLSVVAARAA
jgi:DNA-binding winged helix-turn-helix (wHTH) protein